VTSGDNNLCFSRINELQGSVGTITRPTLILDAGRTKLNIACMIRRAADAGVRFRPHFKTHQSAAVGEWFRHAGVSCITVSSLEMARYFADTGWDDITVAFPVNLRQMDLINQLAGQIRLGLLVDHPEALTFLAKHLEHQATIWIKVDAGYGRTGVDWQDQRLASGLARQIAASDRMQFGGLLSHSGHSYSADRLDQLQQIHDESITRLRRLGDQIAAKDLGTCPISIGDTPTCSRVDRLGDADEIRPGNFVFYDLMQLAHGICRREEISLALACPIVCKYPSRNEIVICGGAIHLSKESLTATDGRRCFGQLAQWNPEGFTVSETAPPLTSLSQEHGVVSLPAEQQAQLQIGDLVLVIPVHSCLTAQQFGSYTTLQGKQLERFRP
jgi:D-serine deaminase-like pyridoxal phosphate-dependent protein